MHLSLQTSEFFHTRHVLLFFLLCVTHRMRSPFVHRHAFDEALDTCYRESIDAIFNAEIDEVRIRKTVVPQFCKSIRWRRRSDLTGDPRFDSLCFRRHDDAPRPNKVLARSLFGEDVRAEKWIERNSLTVQIDQECVALQRW